MRNHTWLIKSIFHVQLLEMLGAHHIHREIPSKLAHIDGSETASCASHPIQLLDKLTPQVRRPLIEWPVGKDHSSSRDL